VSQYGLIYCSWLNFCSGDAIMQTNPFSAEFEMLFWTLRTCANHSESFVTWRHSAWRMICDVKLSGKPTCIAALQNLKNTCYVDYAPLPITRVSNKVLSADSLPSNRRTFFSGNNFILNCEVIKTESSDRWLYFARPLGLKLLTLWNSLAH